MCEHGCSSVCAHVWVCARIRACAHVHVHTFVCIRLCGCMHPARFCTQTHNTCKHAHTRTHTTHTQAHTNTHTHTQNHAVAALSRRTQGGATVTRRPLGAIKTQHARTNKHTHTHRHTGQDTEKHLGGRHRKAFERSPKKKTNKTNKNEICLGRAKQPAGGVP